MGANIKDNNIYILINSLGGGGAEKQVKNLINFLPVNTLFLLEKEIKKSNSIKNKNIIFLSSFTNKTSSLLKTLYIPIYVLKLARNINKNSIILSFLERSNFVNILCKLIFKKHKAVIFERTFTAQAYRKLNFKTLFNYLMIKLLYHKSDIFLTNLYCKTDEPAGKYFINNKIKKLVFIPNGFDIERIIKLSNEEINTESEKKIFNSNKKIIISIGRLNYIKGYEYLIKAFKTVNNIIPDSVLVILGEGPLYNVYLNLIKKLDLEDKIFLLGYKANPYKYLKRSDIFVLTSLWEGLPNVIVEAMICKVPVISTDCSPSVRYILNKETSIDISDIYYASYGIIIPNKFENREEFISKSIVKLLKDESLQRKYKVEGFKRIYEFHVEKVAQKFREILEDI